MRKRNLVVLIGIVLLGIFACCCSIIVIIAVSPWTERSTLEDARKYKPSSSYVLYEATDTGEMLLFVKEPLATNIKVIEATSAYESRKIQLEEFNYTANKDYKAYKLTVKNGDGFNNDCLGVYAGDRHIKEVEYVSMGFTGPSDKYMCEGFDFENALK